MKVRTTVLVLVCCLALLAGCVTTIDPNFQFTTNSDQIEPQAGQWKTWVLTSGDELRPAAPPDQAATTAEIEALKALVAQRDAAALEQITYWDAGSPSYRWNQIADAQGLSAGLPPPLSSRAMALMNVAIYDAMVATWDAKYTYNRNHPSEFDAALVTLLPNPASPSYPSEHAVAAGAASAILAYIFPDDAQSFNDLAQAAAESRSLAGVSFPSDVEAGLALGRAVAAKVIGRAEADGSDAQWTGTVPTGPGMWSGDTVAFPLMGTWKTWVLESGDQVRLDPPPAFDSPELLAELDEVKNFTRTEQSTMSAMYWQSDDGGPVFLDWASRHIFEQKLDSNPPRAARVYALMSVASYDALVACFDTKYTYWQIRPAQLDPTITTLFSTPPHPSYPSAHACNSGAAAYVLAYLFPSDGQAVVARAENAADSRIWAGIHYRSDRDGGLAIANSVAELVIERAKADGADNGN
jgi:membrane-associated phospholipid phosphatase